MKSKVAAVPRSLSRIKWGDPVRTKSPIGRARVFYSLNSQDGYAIRELRSSLLARSPLFQVLVLRDIEGVVKWLPQSDDYRTFNAAASAIHRHRRTGTWDRAPRKRRRG